MIHRDNGSESRPEKDIPRLVELNLSSWRLKSEFKAQQRPIRRESPSCFDRFKPRLKLLRSGGSFPIYAVQPYRPAQRGVVTHEICPCCGRQPETAVQQLVPYCRRGFMVGKANNLDVIHLAERDIGGQFKRDRVSLR